MSRSISSSRILTDIKSCIAGEFGRVPISSERSSSLAEKSMSTPSDTSAELLSAIVSSCVRHSFVVPGVLATGTTGCFKRRAETRMVYWATKVLGKYGSGKTTFQVGTSSPLVTGWKISADPSCLKTSPSAITCHDVLKSALYTIKSLKMLLFHAA